MRFSLPVIGLTTALLLGSHIDAHLDPVNNDLVGNALATEAVTLVTVNRDASAVTSSSEQNTVASNTSASTETTAAETAATILEEIKAPNRSEELKASLYEIEKALKETTLAVAEVLNGVVSLVAPIGNIAISVAILGVTLAKIFWFSSKLLYTTGIVATEGMQTAHAYLTQ